MSAPRFELKSQRQKGSRLPTEPTTGSTGTMYEVVVRVLFTQFRVFSTQVLAFILPTCWVQHSQHAPISPSSTLLLVTRVCPLSIPTLLATSPTFSAAAVYQLCCRRHGCGWKRFRFVGLHVARTFNMPTSYQ